MSERNEIKFSLKYIYILWGGVSFFTSTLLGQTIPLTYPDNLLIPLDSQVFHFNHFTEEDGLPDNHVWAACVDQTGFMWFGTPNGLSRFDGYAFKHFKYIKNGPARIHFPMVVDIIQAEEDTTLWLATLGDGLIRFNPKTEEGDFFKHKPNELGTLSGNEVNCIYQDVAGDIWIGLSSSGFNKFDNETNSFQTFILSDNFSNKNEAYRLNTVHDITNDPDQQHILWLAADNGLYKFNKHTKTLDHFPSQAPNSSGMSCLSLVAEEGGNLWVGTYGGGLVHFNTKENIWNYFPPNISEWENKGFNTNIIYDILPKSSNELWVCTENQGLLIFNKNTKTFSSIKYGIQNIFSLPDKGIRKIYADPMKRLWILSLNNGISLHNPQSSSLQFHPIVSKICTGENSHFITDFCWDKRMERLYLSAKGCGMYVFDQNKNQLNPLLPSPYGDTYQNFDCILLDHTGKVWIGGSSNARNETDIIKRPSLVLYDPTEGSFSPFEHPMLPKIPLQSYHILDIIEDRQHRLWLATQDGGLIKIDLKTNELKQFVRNEYHSDFIPSNSRITQLLEDQQGCIWLATTEHGLYRFDPTTEKFLYISIFSEELSKTHISALEEDNQGRIWVGLKSQGIKLVETDSSGQVFVSHLNEGRLTSKRIVKIVKDTSGDIWISTESGLNLYQVNTGEIVTFQTPEGLDDPYLYGMGMALIEETGEILLGQHKGFYSIKPDMLYEQKDASPLVFTNFYVFDEEKRFEKHINYIEEITLNPDENFFSIAFSLLNYNYHTLKKTKYEYKLQGHDPDWNNYTAYKHIASYTNVREGNYSFLLKTKGKDKIERIIRIKVLPPWYRKWWAYISYIFLVFLLIRTLYIFQLRRKLAQEEIIRFKDLDATKTRLITNITHEFRTPLTLIQGAAGNILEYWENNEKKMIEIAVQSIKRNGQNLLNLVNQLLDLAKLDAKQLKLDFRTGDIIVFFKDMLKSFDAAAIERKINLQLTYEIDSLVMDFDPGRLQQIVFNLLGNALKFTPEGGAIFVKIQMESIATRPQLIIYIEDTGNGIPTKNIPYIFDRFYQVDHVHTSTGQGTGIGLSLVKELIELMEGNIEVESQEGKGTTFKIKLPIKNESIIPASFSEYTPIPEKSLPKERPTSVAPTSDEKDKLLLIEDHPELLTYIKDLLSEDYQIITATNGLRGIEQAIEDVPDLIVSDIMMPKKNGYEVCHILKEDPRTSHIPIILLTAKADIKDKIAGWEHGADAYLSKPFQPKELFVIIRQLIIQRKKLQEVYKHSFPNAPNSSATNKQAQKENIFLKNLNEIVEENMDNENMDVELIRARLNMSRSQMHRKLKALTGLSITQYIRKIRLHKAKELLESTDMGVIDVAYMVGFKDRAHFSRTFSEEFGLPPSFFKG